MKVSKKTKVLSLAAAFLIFGSAGTSGLGLGLQFGGGFSDVGRGSLAFLLSGSKNHHLAVAFSFGENYWNVGASYDWWLFHPELTKIGKSVSLKFFLGPGIGVDVGSGSDFYLGAGLRVPVGIDFEISKFDIFVQAVPHIGLNVSPFYFPAWGIDGALGARFWL